MFLFSVIPFLVFVFLFFLKRIRLIFISLTSLLLTLILAIVFWQMKINFIYASFLKGIFVALDVLIIIFGAIFFLETLKETKIIDQLCLSLEALSKDYRVQVILIAWFLENFLEGTAGFGTPSTVAAPLLIGIGLSPLTAVVVALLGNSAAGVFGAAGTPIRVGFSGLDVLGVPRYSALINLVGFIVPVFMLWAITEKQEERKRHFLECLPLAIFSGLAFVVPSVLFVSLGQEFPSILGSITGLLAVMLAIKFNFLAPKVVRTLRTETIQKEKMPIFKIILPYGLLLTLLILGKFILGNVGLTASFGLKHTFNLFNPGLAFIMAAIPVIFLWEKDFKTNLKALTDSFKRSIEPFLVIALMSVMTQLMINSGQNSLKLPSMLHLIADRFQTRLLPFIAPFAGAFGGFITGSVTVSNLMFGSFFQDASLVMGLSTALILSLEIVGAAAGNMIALADILPALAVVGLKGKEGEIVKRVILPCLVYVFLVGLIGMLLAF